MILGIYGSPRKGGNTDILLDEALKAAEEAGAEVKRVYCRRLKISGCLECGGCDPTGECVIDDGMAEVYPLMEQASAIVLASPIFFYGLPAQAKALVDRSQACWAKRLLKKPKSEWKNYESGRGYLVAAGATKGGNLFDGSELCAKYFYDAMDMSYEGGLFYRQVEAKGSIREHPEAVAQAVELGKKLAANG